MTPPPRRPSLAAVAERVGVSTATVSHAFNRPERISAETRRLVLEAAAELDYAGPNPVGRQLRRGKADALGMVFHGELGFPFEDPSAARFMAGLSAACSGAGLNLLLIPAALPQPGSAVGSVARAAVDGFVVYSVADDDPHLDSIRSRRLPTVVVDSPVDPAGADWVGSDDDAGARLLAQHLVESGHRRTGVICSRLTLERNDGPASEERWRHATYAVARGRLRGLADGLAANAPDCELVVEERFDNSAAAGGDALLALRARRPDLTAIVCLSDLLALGALATARAAGIGVPEALTITGYDDVPEASRVGLTTVRQPLDDKGRIAGELFLSQGDGPPRRRRLDLELRVRQTSGPAPSPTAPTA